MQVWKLPQDLKLSNFPLHIANLTVNFSSHQRNPISFRREKIIETPERREMVGHQSKSCSCLCHSPLLPTDHPENGKDHEKREAGNMERWQRKTTDKVISCYIGKSGQHTAVYMGRPNNNYPHSVLNMRLV